ncbi:hypothetical protein J4448_05940 [Candidatus Woesearchaeota archaeon]|nr:hypothetical protein [Candidatus Woesearchaeota archaeon]
MSCLRLTTHLKHQPLQYVFLNHHKLIGKRKCKCLHYQHQLHQASMSMLKCPCSNRLQQR